MLRRGMPSALNLSCKKDLGAEFIERWKLFSVSTMAASKDEYLRRPDLGRRLDENAQAQLLAQCPLNADLQIVIGDGLSVTAVSTQVPPLLPLLAEKGTITRMDAGPAVRNTVLPSWRDQRCRRTASAKGSGVAHRRTSRVWRLPRAFPPTWHTSHGLATTIPTAT